MWVRESSGAQSQAPLSFALNHKIWLSKDFRKRQIFFSCIPRTWGDSSITLVQGETDGPWHSWDWILCAPWPIFTSELEFSQLQKEQSKTHLAGGSAVHIRSEETY